ncbi:MAG: YbaN family protein [Salinarimonas sp.]|nr:YbaN family protein [Salinarimonas sp.]
MRAFFYRCAGFASLGLGAIGIVMPLLPTTPFVILAAFCFTRADPKLAAWLHAHPRFGPTLRDWRDQRAISLRAKIMAMIAIAVSYAISVALAPMAWAPWFLALVMGCVALFILTRPSPGPPPDPQTGKGDTPSTGPCSDSSTR